MKSLPTNLWISTPSRTSSLIHIPVRSLEQSAVPFELKPLGFLLLGKFKKARLERLNENGCFGDPVILISNYTCNVNTTRLVGF